MTSPQRRFTAVELVAGTTYRVVRAFQDYDGATHPVGERWVYCDKSFAPYDDGLTLVVESAGQRRLLRLQWRDEMQGPVIDAFSDHVVAESP